MPLRSQLLRPSLRRHLSTFPSHTSLPTFLAHAARTSLSRTSSLYIGTYYEYLCLSALRSLSCSLTRTGGRSDHGIDLLGMWHLPTCTLPVLVQCKAVKGKAGPEMVREVEGAVGRRGNVVGVLCGKGEATKGVRDAVRASTVGLVWVRVCDAGRVRQLLWNERVGGKIGMGVGVRYVKEGSGWGKEAVLTWDGGVWEGRGEAEEKTEMGFEDLVGDGG